MSKTSQHSQHPLIDERRMKADERGRERGWILDVCGGIPQTHSPSDILILLLQLVDFVPRKYY